MTGPTVACECCDTRDDRNRVRFQDSAYGGAWLCDDPRACSYRAVDRDRDRRNRVQRLAAYRAADRAARIARNA